MLKQVHTGGKNSNIKNILQRRRSRTNQREEEMVARKKSFLSRVVSLLNNPRGEYRKKLEALEMAFDFVQEANKLPVEIFIEIRLAVSKCLRHVFWNFFWGGGGCAELEVLLQKLLKACPSEFLSRSDVALGGKRIPSFSETCEATMKRLRVFEELFLNLKPSFQSIILGGSLSYGAFHSVRDPQEESTESASDIDVLLIAEKMTGNLTENFPSLSFLAQTDVEVFLERFRHFQFLWSGKKADLISQKFPVVDGRYDVSLHLFPFLTLKRILGKEFRKNLLRGKDLDFYLQDYRLISYPLDFVEARNFFGELIQIDVSRKNPVAGGVINLMPSYVVRQDRFHPSVWHNLVSPEFQVVHDVDGKVSRYVRRFRGYMKKRAREEGLGKHDFRNSHIRSPVFQAKLPF